MLLSIEMERHDKLGDNDMEVFCLSEACTLRTVRSAITAYYLRCQRRKNNRKKDLACIEERSCLRKTAKHVVVGYFQDVLSSCQN